MNKQNIKPFKNVEATVANSLKHHPFLENFLCVWARSAWLILSLKRNSYFMTNSKNKVILSIHYNLVK